MMENDIKKALEEIGSNDLTFFFEFDNMLFNLSNYEACDLKIASFKHIKEVRKRFLQLCLKAHRKCSSSYLDLKKLEEGFNLIFSCIEDPKLLKRLEEIEKTRKELYKHVEEMENTNLTKDNDEKAFEKCKFYNNDNCEKTGEFCNQRKKYNDWTLIRKENIYSNVFDFDKCIFFFEYKYKSPTDLHRKLQNIDEFKLRKKSTNEKRAINLICNMNIIDAYQVYSKGGLYKIVDKNMDQIMRDY